MSSDRIIGRDNYEEFFLDWLDGNLDSSLLPSFMHFLKENPDLSEELREMEQVRIQPERTVSALDKTTLKKKVRPAGRVHEANFEQTAVAALEGELSREEAEELEQFLVLNPAYRYDIDLYGKTKLTPDPGVVCPDRDKLKRRPLLPFVLFRFAVPAAAAMLLLLLLWRAFLPSPAEDRFPDKESSSVTTPVLPAGPVNAAGHDEVLADAAIAVTSSSPSLPEKPAPVSERTVTGRMTALTSTGIDRIGPGPDIEYVRKAMSVPGSAVLADNPGRQGILGKIIRNYSQKAAERGGIIQEVVRENNPAGNLNLWELADLGVKSINKLTDREMALTVVRAPTGSPKEYTLVEDDRILLSRTLDQP